MKVQFIAYIFGLILYLYSFVLTFLYLHDILSSCIHTILDPTYQINICEKLQSLIDVLCFTL